MRVIFSGPMDPIEELFEVNAALALLFCSVSIFREHAKRKTAAAGPE